ncbi:hypothetical protein B0H17DRAFT_1184497 [Mycena rosella]|uniref:Xylanolytic transcriptional activator regulatory domain-containing protein n=1 Tax=Mycena rosella TaxID=1033263 RepID=A0AAD7CVM8_MYCRO|nr:hypothetical protein B0H17DRAFT_1184497 [Mycena rosella]
MVSNPTRLKELFEEEGFVIIPGLIPPENFSPLESACDHVISRTRDGAWPHRRTVGKQFPPYGDSDPDSWGVQHLMHPDLQEPAFAQWYTSTAVINAVQSLLGCEEAELQMELFNLLINPRSHHFALRWHRDDIAGDATEEEERKALDAWKPHGIQWNTALYADSCLFVVPGSHKASRTPEQRLHSEGQDPPTDPLDMPGAIQVALQPGDSVFYNSNILHCASYDSQARRATLHASMGNVKGGSVRARNVLQHGLSWMKEPQFRDGLDSRGRVMLGSIGVLRASCARRGLRKAIKIVPICISIQDTPRPIRDGEGSRQPNVMNNPLSNDISRPGLGEPGPKAGKPARKISCAECHRLKLKCDRDQRIPCGPCGTRYFSIYATSKIIRSVRRGCDSICPTGALRSTGRGKRSVMSDVPELTAVLTEMGERIRQLEHAIANTQDGASSLSLNATQHPAGSAPAQNAEALGSFSVNEAGNAVYFGPTAGTEAIFSIEGSSGSQSSDYERTSFTTATEAFPFSSGRAPNWDPDQALDQLFSRLPPEARAWDLCERYYQNGCWTGMPVMQDEAVELLNLVYQERHRPVTAHQLAVLYVILALGALVDLDLPSYSSEADHYFDLGCAAMSVESLFENPTVATVQGLVLVAKYYSHGGSRYSVEGGWSMISLASSISQSIAKGSPQNYHPKRLDDVRHVAALFWETYSIETFLGLSVARPTGTFLSNISCPLPPDEDPETQPFVKLYPGFREARWEYMKQVAACVMETFLTTAKPSYATVLELDQKIRKYMLSAPFESFPVDEDKDTPSRFIQRNLFPRFAHSNDANRGTVLMYIHKGSFLEAMRDNPINPLSSSYSASFLAGYRSASEIIKADIRNFTTHPMLFTRWWPIWKTLFNAAVIVGTVATRYPSSRMAPHAIVELFTAVDLVEKGAVSSVRARNGLATLQRLRDKAITVYSKYSGHILARPPTADAEAEDELEIFAGYTRVVANKVIAHRMRTEPSLDTHAGPSGPIPPTQWHNDPEELRQEFDPSIIEYFSFQNPETFFGNAGSLSQPQGTAQDAAQLFSFPSIYGADVEVGLDFQ